MTNQLLSVTAEKDQIISKISAQLDEANTAKEQKESELKNLRFDFSKKEKQLIEKKTTCRNLKYQLKERKEELEKLRDSMAHSSSGANSERQRYEAENNNLRYSVEELRSKNSILENELTRSRNYSSQYIDEEHEIHRNIISNLRREIASNREQIEMLEA